MVAIFLSGRRALAIHAPLWQGVIAATRSLELRTIREINR
jgi:hypothetical protein